MLPCHPVRASFGGYPAQRVAGGLFSRPPGRIVPWVLVALVLLLVALPRNAQAQAKHYSNLTRIGVFTSDGKTPVQITLHGDYELMSILDVEPSPNGPRGDQPILPGARSPGVLIFPVGVTPPFAEGIPPYRDANNPPAAADWNPAIQAASDVPGWPSSWGRTLPPNNDPDNSAYNAMGTVTTKVLPAGQYNIWGTFGLGSIGAPNGPKQIYVSVKIGEVELTGNVPPKNNGGQPNPPRIFVTVKQDTTTKGDPNSQPLAFRFVRVYDETNPDGIHQPLSVRYNIGGSAIASVYNVDQATIEFGAEVAKKKLTITAVDDGVYRAPMSVEISPKGGGNGTVYIYDPTPAVGYILSINHPPQVAFAGLGNWNGDASVTINVGQPLAIRVLYADQDKNLYYTWATASVAGAYSGTTGPQAAGTANYERVFNFTPTAPGDFFFYATASDNLVFSPDIKMTVHVPNRLPTVAWSVPGAYPVNGAANIWELDLQGATTPPTITATGADPDGRLWAVFVHRGTGDPSKGEGTPLARTVGSSATGVLTSDEMLPPLSTSLEGAVWEQAWQDNYSWLSASSQDLDGGTAPPIRLLVRIFNQAPTVPNWTAPAGLSAVNGSATDWKVSVNVNSAAVTMGTRSTDPERKMFAAIISRGYQTPSAGNGDAQEVAVGYASTDGSTATPVYTPGAETFDVPGDHWFSSIAIDKGTFYSGGNSRTSNHLNVAVVNRQPTAAFDGNATTASSYVGGSVHLRGTGNDPDKAMKRVQITLVSAPAAAKLTPGTVLADSSAPSNTQTYPSNLTTWTADGDTVTPVSGSYVYRTTVWDRHGGTNSVDRTILAVNRPPVFAWTQTEIHVLAGQTAILPFTLADPDGNLGYAVATGTNYSNQVTSGGGGNYAGNFAFPTTKAGTFPVTGTGFDAEGMASVAKPQITVVVEAINSAPLVLFKTPPPGGTSLKVTRFVDDIIAVAAEATDVDTNLEKMVVSLNGTSWLESPTVNGNIGLLGAANNFTVPVLGAENEHVHQFSVVATDKGKVAGGTIDQTPRTSAPAILTVIVPNRAPSVVWTVPTGGIGLTQDNPFVGHLLQPLQITASGLDRDGNLGVVSIAQVGGSGSVVTQKSTDGRKADAVFGFTPTVPGMYVFGAAAVDTAGANSGDPISLFVRVEDYPGESTGTLGALVVSPASSPDQVFSSNGLPVIVKGGVAALGRTPNKLEINATGAIKIIPVPAWLNGSQIPPLTPAILDLRTSRVIQRVDHANASLQ